MYRVRSGEGNQSAIVKYGPPFIKCLGPDYPLTTDRTEIEYKALCKFNELSPGSVPTPYFFNKDHNIMCMEDLKSHRILRRDLIESKFDLKLAENIAEHIAVVHRDTHVSKIGNQGIKELDEQFRNPNMVNLTEQYVFTRPFTDGDPTNRCSDKVKERLHLVYEDEKVLSTALRMKELFLTKKECLCHGDLHTSSIMVDETSAKLIDLEFTFVGPVAFDIGMLLANYIFQYYRHMSTLENNDEHRKFAYLMIDTCKTTVNKYLDIMTGHVGDKETYFNTVISEMAGFTGCEIIRRIIGAAHVEDFEDNSFAEQDALGAGVRLLSAVDRIHTIDRLLVIALMLA